MHIGTRHTGAAAALLAAAACWPAQWFAVGGPDQGGGTLVEVDVQTLASRPEGGEALIRVSYPTAQAHERGFTFRSFVGNAHFDCQRRRITITSAAYFRWPQGEGERLAAESAGTAAGVTEALLSSIPAPHRQALLRASCARQPAS